jgi:hypothetical protein
MIVESYYPKIQDKKWIKQVITPGILEILKDLGIKHSKYGKYVEKFVDKYGKRDL